MPDTKKGTRSPRKRTTGKRKTKAQKEKEAAELKEKQRLSRELACWTGIEKLLLQYNCVLTPHIIIAEGRRELGVELLAKDE